MIVVLKQRNATSTEHILAFYRISHRTPPSGILSQSEQRAKFFVQHSPDELADLLATNTHQLAHQREKGGLVSLNQGRLEG
mmetsp:Transcript_13366/g.26851  ORF Transcript_13366/g.26851 Transcript_13366/m.26851 type:complete len:81 (-) Transcript_13366:2897-3139(-)